MFAALALVASLSTPSTLPPPTAATQPRSSWAARAAVVDGRDPRAPVRLAQNTPTPDPNAADHVQTPLEQYFSYQLSPAALPAVKEGQFLSLLLGYLCAPACGSLWGPLVAVKGAEMNGDLAATWLISMLGRRHRRRHAAAAGGALSGDDGDAERHRRADEEEGGPARPRFARSKKLPTQRDAAAVAGLLTGGGRSRRTGGSRG